MAGQTELGHLDPMECVFTHSVHGVERSRKVWAAWRALFHKELATVPVGETFSPFNSDIRILLFSAEVLKKCALLALHVIAEDGDG